MNSIFKKLNFKGQTQILVLNAPESFHPVMNEMVHLTQIDTTYQDDVKYPFQLIFTEMAADLSKAIDGLEGKLEGDSILWFAYPKKSSKNYKSDIYRDSEAWIKLGALNYEGVRQVAIDADWSALRFRNVDYIKTLKRTKLRAMSKKGQERVKDN